MRDPATIDSFDFFLGDLRGAQRKLTDNFLKSVGKRGRSPISGSYVRQFLRYSNLRDFRRLLSEHPHGVLSCGGVGESGYHGKMLMEARFSQNEFTESTGS